MSLPLSTQDSDHVPITFHTLNPVRARDVSNGAERYIDWERFQSPAFELVPSRIQGNSGEVVDKATDELSASTASPYRLSISKLFQT
jgi:hypothetical protein